MVAKSLKLVMVFAVAAVMVISAFGLTGVGSAALGAPTTSAAPTTATPTSSATATTVAGTSSNPANGYTLGVSQTRQQLASDARANTLAAVGNLDTYFPPNLNSAPGPVSLTGGHIIPLYDYSPAPLGIATFGLANTTGTIAPYILDTTSLEGTFTTTDPLGVQAQSPYFSSLTGYGAQLNTVLVNTTILGQRGYDYWLQNVIGYNPFSATNQLSFENNIWNFSSPSGIFPSNSILHGLGRVQSSEYYAVSGPSMTVSYPFTLALYLNSTVGSYSGSPKVNEVYFNYSVWDSAGHHICPLTEPTGEVCGMYDNVYFNSVTTVTPGSAQIEANGYQYNPIGLPTDMEMDWGIGSSSGANANIVYADASVGIYYLNATTGKYQVPYSTYDFGSETGETTTGAYGTFTTGANGAPVEKFTTGPGLLDGLWNASGVSGAYALNTAHIAPSNAFVAIASGVGVTNQSYFQVAPTFGWFSGRGTIGQNIWLQPGMYTVEVMLSSYDMYTATLNLMSSSQTPTITLTRDLSSSVYTPLWAFSSSDLANLSVSGSGTSGSPYIIWGAQSGSLEPVFATLNDYLFGVWSGIWINSTTAYARFDPPPSLFLAYPSWWIPQLASLGAAYGAVPYTQTLPMYFYRAQNITVAHAAQITGWSFNQASRYYAAYVNGGRNDLFYDNYFNVTSAGLDFLGAGVQFAPGAAFTQVGTSYKAWFNETGLVGGTPWSVTLTGVGTISSTTTSILFVGLAAGSYPFTVHTVTGKTPSPASGTLTVTAANVVQAISWSNSGTTYAVTFSETGLATGAPWTVTLNSVTETNYSTTIVFPGLTSGTYAFTVSAVRGYAVNTSSGSVTVAGAKLTRPLSFTAQGTIFSISFAMQGLQSGTTWSVTVGGVTETSISTSLVFPGYMNGIYPWTISSITGYSLGSSSGRANITGSNQANYVWGNTYVPYSLPTHGYPGPYTPGAGLAIAESGDHVYNNAFYTNGTASASATYLDFWNATGGYQPATNWITVNGYRLTGSILGQYIQGGNYWFNYGSVADPYGLPYVARASSPTGTASIGQGADFAPLSPYMTSGSGVVPTGIGTGLYPVTFTETGLVIGNSWAMRLGGVPVYEPALSVTYTTAPTNTTTVGATALTNVLWAPNGTYTWTVATKPTGTSLLVSTGSITVSGASVAVTVAFTWTVTLTESGLSLGVQWAATFNGVLATATVGSGTGTTVTWQVGASTSPYPYTISSITSGWVASPTSGTQTVSGTTGFSTSFSSTASTTYSVFVTQSGLPSGTTWQFWLNTTGIGSNYHTSGTTATLTVAALAGGYTYQVGMVSGYSGSPQNPSTGSVTVTTSAVSVSATYSAVTYTVMFTESGLTGGTPWGLTFGGVFHWSATTTITFQVVPGTYLWQIAYIAGKTPSLASGSTTINPGGPGASYTITFS